MAQEKHPFDLEERTAKFGENIVKYVIFVGNMKDMVMLLNIVKP